MKRFIPILMAVLILSMSISVFAADSQKSVLSVNGTYSLKVEPDVVYIGIGIETNNLDIKVAKEENTNKMNEVKQTFKDLGIEDKYIKTTNYMVSPQYDRQNVEYQNDGQVVKKDESKFLGYRVTNDLEITVYDLKKVGAIYDYTIEKGINKANGINFGLTEKVRDEYYLKALTGSIENAKQKAQTMANVFGIKLTLPKAIHENGAPMYDMGYSNAYNFAMKSGYAGGAMDTPIYSGLITITANVAVDYEY